MIRKISNFSLHLQYSSKIATNSSLAKLANSVQIEIGFNKDRMN